MLIMSEEDPVKMYSVHHRKYFVHHQDLIMSVKEVIKPGLMSIICKPYTNKMVSSYFDSLS